MRTVSAKVPEELYRQLRALTEGGVYRSVSEAVRTAVRDLLLRELWSDGWTGGSEAERDG